MRRFSRKKVAVWGGVLLAAVVLVAVVPTLYTEARWFGSIGQSDVFWKVLLAQWGTGLVAAIAFGGVILASVEVALRACGRLGHDSLGALWGPARWMARGLCLVVAIVFGIGASGYWLEIQMYLNAAPVGTTDPIFGRDLGFFLLELPALVTVRGALVVALWLAAAGAAGVYFVVGRGTLPRPLAWLALRHGSVLAAVLLVLFAAGHFLDRYGLLFAGSGIVAGAGYADVHARIPAYGLCAIFALVAAVACLWTARTLRARTALLGVGLYFLTVVVASWVYPAIVQRFGVEPNELAREKRFIRLGIDGTREAYGLDRVVQRRITADRAPSAEDVSLLRPTVQNIRLWDWQPLLATYGQLQLIRSYYDFQDVDIDRYWLGDEAPRQLMLSVRELAWEKLPANAQTWVNLHLKYTHGYGLVASPVNRVTPEGLPEIWVKDIPPQTDVDRLTLTEPTIYFGERTEAYVLVNTSTPEFDYPAGDRNVTTRYGGRGGVRIGGVLSRLAWSIRLASSQVLLSGYISPDTRVLVHRQVVERIGTVAPFLVFDRDAYPVVANGRIQWILDGYTIAGTYPFAEANGGYNYIRNSVKAVVDAYDGTVTLYVNDPDDPILGAYRRIFPELFTPLDRMPPELRRHLRYPVDLFRIQVSKYVTYHMDDPEVFYNKEDLWAVPEETVGDERRQMEPYYVTMQLEEGEPAEFLLMLPLVPARRDNMIAWLAARNDGAHIGQLVVYTLPKDRLVYGPMQIEARIDQDPVVSQQLTLWDQRGSQVVRGTLLVVPMKDGFLYVEPVYLQAERGKIPELKRVIVAVGDQIEMRETLEEAIAAAVGAAATPAVRAEGVPDEGEGAEGEGAEEQVAQPVPAEPSPEPAAGEGAPPEARVATATDAERRALGHLEAAKAKLAAGDWAGWGAEMAALERALREAAGDSE